MIYRNKKTGNVINIACKLSGDDWEEVKGIPKTPAKKAVKKDAGTVRNNE